MTLYCLPHWQNKNVGPLRVFADAALRFTRTDLPARGLAPTECASNWTIIFRHRCAKPFDCTRRLPRATRVRNHASGRAERLQVLASPLIKVKQRFQRKASPRERPPPVPVAYDSPSPCRRRDRRQARHASECSKCAGHPTEAQPFPARSESRGRRARRVKAEQDAKRIRPWSSPLMALSSAPTPKACRDELECFFGTMLRMTSGDAAPDPISTISASAKAGWMA